MWRSGDVVNPFDLWQVRVFVGPRALGNVTGVVVAGPDTGTEEMAAWATCLGFPDTAFVRMTARGPEVLSFSPYEEMRLCTQTLLATDHVLRRAGVLAGDEPMHARTRAGVVTVTPRAGDAPVSYVDLPSERTTVRRPTAVPPGIDAATETFVVDTGRARVYAVQSPDVVEAARPAPEAVRRYCAEEKVSGVCLVAPTGDPGRVLMRVFTMSLDGAEDAATGGAAGGLPALWQARGRALPGEITVEQGTGGAQTRAVLRVLPSGRLGALVGGRVEPVSAGRLHHVSLRVTA